MESVIRWFLNPLPIFVVAVLIGAFMAGLRKSHLWSCLCPAALVTMAILYATYFLPLEDGGDPMTHVAILVAGSLAIVGGAVGSFAVMALIAKRK